MRRTVQRGIVALAIAGSLSIAGAHPAAAADLGLMRQISHLWSFFLGAPSPAPAPHQATTGKPVQGKATSASGSSEGGWGVDPNGNSLHLDPIVPPSGG